MFAFQMFLAILAALLCYSAIMYLLKNNADKIKSNGEKIKSELAEVGQKGAEKTADALSFVWTLVVRLVVWAFYFAGAGYGWMYLKEFMRWYEFSSTLIFIVAALYMLLFLHYFVVIRNILGSKE